MEQAKAGAGSVWTWTAIDADTKLIVAYTLGDRGAATAQLFMRDVASRISNRIQLTTDGHRVYAEAVEDGLWFRDRLRHGGQDLRRIGRQSRVTLQPRILHRLPYWRSSWKSRSQPHQHIICRAQQSFNANGDAAIHSPN